MADKVVVNLATGLEDAERVTVAFLVAGAAVEQGKPVAMFLTKEAVRSAGGGELLVCPTCFNALKLDEADLVANARLGGATPLWEWIGERATVFSY